VAEADSRASASLLLSQLADEPMPAARPAPPAPAPAPISPQRREPVLTDTAALMRELSSLGTEDGGSHAVAVPRTVAPSPGQHARKRKGLFGRS
jgi:hypothetical protein